MTAKARMIGMKDIRVSRTSSREYARAENSKRHRRKRKRSYMLYYILLFLFVLIAFITLSVTVFFNISQIQVEGLSTLKAEDIIASSGIKTGDNLFRLGIAKAEEKIKKEQVYVDEVTISRQLPSTLLIQVTEAKPTVNLKVTGKDQKITYAYLSAKGRVLEVGQKAPDPNLITLDGLGNKVLKKGDFLNDPNDERQKALQTIISMLEEVGLKEIKGIDLTNLADIKLNYQNRIVIELGSMSDLSYKLTFAKDVIENRETKETKGILNAKEAGKVYFETTLTNPTVSSEITSSQQASSGQTSSGHASSGSQSSENAHSSSQGGSTSSKGRTSSQGGNSSNPANTSGSRE